MKKNRRRKKKTLRETKQGAGSKRQAEGFRPYVRRSRESREQFGVCLSVLRLCSAINSPNKILRRFVGTNMQTVLTVPFLAPLRRSLARMRGSTVCLYVQRTT